MKTRRFKSAASSPGIAIGRAHKLHTRGASLLRYWIRHRDVDSETSRLKKAIQRSKEQLDHIQAKMCRFQGHDQVKILESYRMFLQDEMLVMTTLQNIEQNKINAEWALDKTLAHLKLSFLNVNEDYFKERQQDIDYVGRRIMDNLTGMSTHQFTDIPSGGVIIIAHDLSPAEVANLPKDRVKGFIMESGGETSHTAIISRALEIPAIFGAKDIFDEIEDGEQLILDGMKGILIASPSAREKSQYVTAQESYAALEKILMQDIHLPAVTKDSYTIHVEGNMELVEEVPSLIDHGAEGIGLYRTEYLFLNRIDEPSEEEQLENYIDVLERMAPRPVTIRTIDLGADKLPIAQGYETQANPALGLRGIRLCLREIPIFKTQLRALLRASVYGNLNILLPMISDLDEILRVKKIIAELRQELAEQKVKVAPEIPLGIMIEVPSAVFMAEEFAKEVDFFSIGTNDLIQYGVAIDRINELVSHLYNPFHPAVLRMIKMAVSAAKKSGVRVSLCGELAGNPLAIPLLVGMGLESLSMNPISIPRVKKIIRSISRSQTSKLVKDVLSASSADAVEKLLKKSSTAILPGDVKKLHLVDDK